MKADIEKEREAMFKEICDLVDDSAQMIPLVTKPVTVGYRADLVPQRRPGNALVVWRPRSGR